MDIEQIKKEMKNKRKTNKPHTYKYSRYSKYISNFLITVIITLISLITLKVKPDLKQTFYKYIYEDNIKFTYFKKMYNKYFGSILPETNKTETVFDEKMTYESVSKYEDGCKLKVSKNYLIPAIESGMVVYIGDKDKLNNTIIIQQINGVDVWYGNINSASVKLYDYVEKGSLIGEAKDDTLYLMFKKDGTVLNYEDYL